MTDALRNLPEATFAGVRFPVERLEWNGGNDLVEHTAYRRPGADVEPTGRKATRGSMTIPFINTPLLVARYGELFPGLRYDLLQAIEQTPIATLMHPTLGQMTAAIGDVSETASADDRGGVRMTVNFVEHNASVALLVGTEEGSVPTDTTQSVSESARAADAANSGIVGYQATRTTIDAKLAYLDAAPRSYTQTTAALREMLAPVTANLALPALSPASANAAYVASLTLRSRLYSLRDQLIPNAQAQRIYTTPRVMADWEVALAVYGDASLGALVRGANSITNPNAIGAGRALVILPAPSA